MIDIVKLFPTSIREKIGDDVIRKKMNKISNVYNHTFLTFDFLGNYYNNKCKEEICMQENIIKMIKIKFLRRYLSRFKFNNMIFKKIILEKCKIDHHIIIGSIKSYLFPSNLDLFIF